MNSHMLILHCKFLGVSKCDLLEFHNITYSVGNSGPDSDSDSIDQSLSRESGVGNG